MANLVKYGAPFGALLFFSVFAFGQTCEIARTEDGKILRNKNEIANFKKHNVCPGTGKIEKSCKGFVVDHVLPMCACGADIEQNYQWQEYKQSKLKDKIEVAFCNCISGRNPNCRPARLAN